jgi:hypothetical protein
MANEGGEWIMHGMDWDDPRRVRSWTQAIDWIEEVGFVPLFQNEVAGFSLEEHTSDLFWWSGDPAQDPWEWRQLIARSGKVAYGKFFGKKAGFVSKEWFPHLANYRRDGYDFDSRWDEGLASVRSKRVMDSFSIQAEYYSFELKRIAGFGKDGEKNFEGTVTDLQMQTYLVIRDFRRRINKKGGEYGWPVSVYTTPESLWGYDHISSAYSINPQQSQQKLYDQLRQHFPDADDREIWKVLG